MLGFMSAPGLTLPAIDAHRTHQFQGIEFGASGSLSIYVEMLSPARLFLTHRKSADMFRNNQGWGAGGLFLCHSWASTVSVTHGRSLMRHPVPELRTLLKNPCISESM